MLNKDGRLDDEEKAYLKQQHIGRKERMAYVVIVLIFVVIVGLWVKEQYGLIPSLVLSMVGAATIFTGSVVMEKHDRQKFGG